MATHDPIRHLLLRLKSINRGLRAAVDEQSRVNASLQRPNARALCVTDDQVRALLSSVETSLGPPEIARATQAEIREIQALRQTGELPLDVLEQALSLTACEVDAVLLCAAPDIDRGYERIFAFIQDDLNCRRPTAALLAAFFASSTEDRLARLPLFGRYGTLCRTGALEELSFEGRTQYRTSSSLLSFLLGTTPSLPVLLDPNDVELPSEALLPAAVTPEAVSKLCASIRDRRVRVIGVWGPAASRAHEVVYALARGLGRPLRRLMGEPSVAGLQDALTAAAVLDAPLWIDMNAHDFDSIRSTAAAVIAASRVTVVLTGKSAWRPTPLLEHADYYEVELEAASTADRGRAWAGAAGGLDPERAATLAARYSLDGSEMRAVTRTARVASGHRGSAASPLGADVESACAIVTRKHGSRFASLITPRRGAADLVLPPDLHRQVLEAADFFLASGRVYEEWRFGRKLTGGGIKAIFSGQPGTGKTLAAEVIAGRLGVPLLNADLSRITSKWVGETSKHLDEVFAEAENAHCVLAFQDGESLFGKRGQVVHGTDRLSNLEVGYLLERLESFSGLAILTSNLKDDIDEAFLRRFQVILHFPPPAPAERRRIWELALRRDVPLESDVDIETFVPLEMTGAAIMNSACTAAFLAVSEGRDAVGMTDVVRGVARQFQRDSRILNTAHLGQYAAYASA